MVRRIVCKGPRHTIAFAVDKSGASPGADFFDALAKGDQVKLMVLFDRLSQGAFSNPEQFGDLGDGLFEFKSHQIRMPYAHAKDERHLVLITHGFIKKKNRAPKEEIERAWRIYNQDQSRARIALVKKART